jgi:hypothetical protein
MVTQYVYDGFEGGMTEKECGDYVTVEDYFILEKRHDDFLTDVRKVFDTLCSGGLTEDIINNLESAFMAEAHPRGVSDEAM